MTVSQMMGRAPGTLPANNLFLRPYLFLCGIDLGTNLLGFVFGCKSVSNGNAMTANWYPKRALVRWSSKRRITSSTASSGAKRRLWLSLIFFGLPPRSSMKSMTSSILGIGCQHSRQATLDPSMYKWTHTRGGCGGWLARLLIDNGNSHHA